MVAAAKYGFIAGALPAETYVPGKRAGAEPQGCSTLATNKLLGFPIFILIMFFMSFCATFVLGQYPMEWIEGAVGWLADVVDKLMHDRS